MLDQEQEYGDDMQYLNVITPQDSEPINYKHCVPKGQDVSKEECIQHNAKFVATTSLTGQISAYIDDQSQVERYVDYEESTRCIWAIHKSGKENCNVCIEGLSRSKEASITTRFTRTLSSSSSLTFLEKKSKKTALATCMNNRVQRHTKCLRLVLLPNFMCEYEDQAMIPKAAFDHSNDLLDTELSSRLLGDLKMESEPPKSSAMSEANPFIIPPDQGSKKYRLFGVDVDLTSKN
uniref:AlNc14C4G555 protein n=1 Tax=Albugo laibachii Nc14 TaxID=890382 RepID=F0W0B2_9STRA|nr:AlNc14C4G555 [Albugo laibachii Nc14]|eukprot:CCA14484.1 AlNc14C4G555 [Albugo laibachii Nc14]